MASDSLDVVGGRLSRRALALVLEWALEHHPELRENWLLAAQHQPLTQIPGLQ
jgi:hypothetical protein